MTTLELAEQIASAVIEACHDGCNTAEAVLDTLDKHDAWFCRTPRDAEDGTRHVEDIRAFPYQPELFT